ncbi:Tripartite-type tricarboxylate transporter, receptor component TctC [Cupriavidus sp. YR651]|uniref:tripartite tricarboxylate transporter substrate binding protein n=1 Tax=Cupriavidus sp. YR651 TaxID=1855315 RepID=UPI00088F47F6|nr:tripartite tricarboxylate transporter substrate binding protein [Cupriavidus sp. YR651]SDD88896.1 Tripartite-type tricarboxylate transporter, receptor component TctC [Cupriavidus sp. YR651]
MTTRRAAWLGLAVALLSTSLAGAAQAASACATVRIVVPFPAGGAADQLARTVSQGLQQRRGTTIVVDNKPGANGNIGIDAVRRAAGDGCTWLVVPAGNLTINPTLFPALSYNVTRDFKPVSLLASSPNVLAVHPSVKARTVPELIALARQADQARTPLGYASPGVGSGLHLAGELFHHKAGVKMLHVPYKGTTQAVNDVVGGQVPVLFGTWPTLAPFIQSGALRALAVTQSKRSPAAPDVPSLAEQGVPGIDVSSWYALLVPGATPQPLADALSADVRVLFATPTVRNDLQRQGLEPVASTPEALAARIRDDTAAWATLIRTYHITAD